MPIATRHYFAVEWPRRFNNEIVVHKFPDRAARDKWVDDYGDPLNSRARAVTRAECDRIVRSVKSYAETAQPYSIGGYDHEYDDACPVCGGSDCACLEIYHVYDDACYRCGEVGSDCTCA